MKASDIRTDINKIEVRTIEKRDNPDLAVIIRSTLEEFGAARPGTVYYDPSTDQLFELFNSTPRSTYYVAEEGRKILGGGGILASPGLPANTCELVKMYLLSQARGIGLGRKLIQQCIDFAKDEGYQNIYLESMPELKQALKTYEQFGFQYLSAPMGNTGHFGCGLWMIKKLNDA